MAIRSPNTLLNTRLGRFRDQHYYEAVHGLLPIGASVRALPFHRPTPGHVEENRAGDDPPRRFPVSDDVALDELFFHYSRRAT